MKIFWKIECSLAKSLIHIHLKVALIVLLLSPPPLAAQQYEQTLKKCVKNFHVGIDAFAKENNTAEHFGKGYFRTKVTKL